MRQTSGIILNITQLREPTGLDRKRLVLFESDIAVLLSFSLSEIDENILFYFTGAPG